MYGNAELGQQVIFACAQCALIAYGTISVVVPLLKLRAARKRALQAAEDGVTTESDADLGELQPQPQLA